MVKHKSGVTNRVADALSRRKNLLTQMSIEVPSFESFAELFETDPYFSAIVAKVKVGERTDYLFHNEFLFKGNQLYVLDCSLRLRIIKELHGEGHVG